MHSIKTISNNRIKEIVKLHQKKYRDESGLYIAEGFKVLEELLIAKAEIIEVIALKNTDTNKINFPITFVDEATMKKISTTDTICEIITIAKKRIIELNELKKSEKIILLDSISDPGNLGTIIRSAAAFGIDGIILYGNCVDLYSPKVIRSATGNLLKTPIIQMKNKNELEQHFQSHTKIATALSKENNISLKDCAKLEKCIIMLGSEAKGLCKELTDFAEKNIRLEMKNDVESLNLSVSASIILYELFTQKIT